MRTLLFRILKRKFFATIAVAISGIGVIAPAFAIPPTVTPSPGYDARLAEQRRAAEAQARAHTRKPLSRRPAPRRLYGH